MRVNDQEIKGFDLVCLDCGHSADLHVQPRPGSTLVVLTCATCDFDRVAFIKPLKEDLR